MPSPSDINKVTSQAKNKASSTLEGFNKGTVWGSWGYEFQALNDIERERTDGVTLIDLNPEARVFICGAEVTKDVVNVTTNSTDDNGNTCEIVLANPKKKYNISIQDLIKDGNTSRWREDKDINGTYEHSWLKKQGRPSFGQKLNSFLNDVGTISGQISTQIQDIINSFKKSKTGVPLTRLLYEIKFRSGYDKKAGELVFDFKDPVYVFFKGRFSTFWYFGFTGVVNSVSETFRYGSSQTVTLQCIDPLLLMKRKRFTRQTSFVRAGMLEQSIRYGQENQNVFKDGIEPKDGLDGIFKKIFFEQNKNLISNVVNCHPYYALDEGTSGDPKKSYTITNYEYTDSKSTSEQDLKKQESSFIQHWYKYLLVKNKSDPLFIQTKKKQFEVFDLQSVEKNPEVRKIKKEPVTYSNIHFLFDQAVPYSENTLTSSSALGERTKKDLDSLYQQVVVNSANNATITIVGHTDNHGTKAHNSALSLQRANAIKTLIEKRKAGDPKYGTKVITILTKGVGSSESYYKKYKSYPIYEPDLSDSMSSDVTAGTSVSSWYINSSGEYQSWTTTKPQEGYGWSSPPLVSAGSDLHDVFDRRIEVIEESDMTSVSETTASYDDYANWVIQQKPHLADPNGFKFGPWSFLYYQYNQLNISEFTEKNLKLFFDTSIRFWPHYQPAGGIKELVGDEKEQYTGWRAHKAHGVCGIHPALTEDFINNFHIIEEIYATMITNEKLLDQVNMTPLEKIQETVMGVPTELPSKNGPTQLSSQYNYFRPRVFFIMPQYASRQGVFKLEFSDLQIWKKDTISTYDAIREYVNKTNEFTLYCSPMGDIFIEPLMYDFHPFKFYDKIEERDPVLNREKDTGNTSTPIWFRVTKNTTEGEQVFYKKDYAYLINPKANYPFFLSNKDMTGFTHVENPEFYKTSVMVQGAMSDTSTNAIALNVLLDSDPFETAARLNISQSSKTTPSIFQTGAYIADGFSNILRDNNKHSFFGTASEEYNTNVLKYEFKMVQTLLAEKPNISVLTFIQDATRYAKNYTDAQTGTSPNLYVRYPLRQLFQRFKKKNPGTQGSETELLNILTSYNLTTEHVITLNVLYNQLANTILMLYYRELDPTRSYVGTGGSTIDTALLETLKSNMTVSDLLNLKIKDISEGYYIDNGLPTSLQESLPDKYAIQTSKDASKARFDLLTGLSYFHETSYMSTVPDSLKSLNDSLYAYEATLADQEIFNGKNRTINYGKLKQLEKLHLYNPRMDYVSKYGINEGPTIYYPFVKQGPEAVEFAKVIFNRYLAQATEYNVTLIGRPEIWRNRPYFIEDKQCIGWLKNYTISYGINQPFTTVATLTYIRKNSITYSYTTNGLDSIVTTNPEGSESTYNNKWFNDEAVTYTKNFYKADKLKQQQETTNSLFNNLANQNSLAAAIAGAAGQELANIAFKQKLDTIMSNGGMYVAHDYIGHVAYTKNSKDEYIKGSVTADLKDDPRFSNKLGPYFLLQKQIFAIFDACKQLQLQFDRLKTAEAEYVQNKVDIDNIKKQIQTVNDDIDNNLAPAVKDLNNQLAQHPGDKSILAQLLEKTRQFQEANRNVQSMEIQQKGLESNFDTRTTNLQNLYFFIYGFNVTFSVSNTEVTRSPDPTKSIGTEGLLNVLWEAIPINQDESFGSDQKAIRSNCKLLDDIGYQNKIKQNQAAMLDITSFGSVALYLDVK